MKGQQTARYPKSFPTWNNHVFEICGTLGSHCIKQYRPWIPMLNKLTYKEMYPNTQLYVLEITLNTYRLKFVNTVWINKWYPRVFSFKFLNIWLSFRRNGIILNSFLAISFLVMPHWTSSITLLAYISFVPFLFFLWIFISNNFTWSSHFCASSSHSSIRNQVENNN